MSCGRPWSVCEVVSISTLCGCGGFCECYVSTVVCLACEGAMVMALLVKCDTGEV